MYRFEYDNFALFSPSYWFLGVFLSGTEIVGKLYIDMETELFLSPFIWSYNVWTHLFG